MVKHYHLIGIGGIGMSGIAHLLLRSGLRVSGSDLKESSIIDELRRLGANIFIGHSAQNMSDIDVVVYSSAVTEDNPEIIEAKKRNIPIIKRAQALAELMKDKIVIAVSGSHGKTTTTSLISYMLLEAELFPTVAIGGILRNIDSNAFFGKGKFFVAEADESDGSFLYYEPDYAIVTNLDREHLDYYKDFQKEVDAFAQFLNRTKESGCVFSCSEDENLMKIIKGYKNKHILFGLNENADIYPKNIEFKELSSEFDCFYKNKFIDRFYLALGGAHNISNALSVIALGLELGVDLKFIKKTLANYQGAKRRLEVKFKGNDILIIDDYAHHPTEIKATLEATKNLKPKRCIAIFQPHRYSRTKILLGEFAGSFSNVDKLILTDIYSAGEFPIEGVSAKNLYDRIIEQGRNKDVKYLPKQEIVNYVLSVLMPGDLVITLGAGDIVKISDELAEGLKRKSKI